MPVERKILVVEDESLLRNLIANLLESEGFLVQTAGSAAEAKRVAKLFDPDLALLDIELGDGPNGLDLAEALLALYPAISVFFLTHVAEPRLVDRTKRVVSRNTGYLVKSRVAEPSYLVSAIDAALRGRVSIDHQHFKTPDHMFTKLSNTQLDVVKYLAAGLTPSQIAIRRGTTPRAVRNVVARAIDALDLNEVDEGMARATLVREYLKVAGTPRADA
jgi:DNA-binding NarL/FixJ family response regulator